MTYTATRETITPNGAKIQFTIGAETQAKADAKAEAILLEFLAGKDTETTTKFRLRLPSRYGKSVLTSRRVVAANQIANALFACAAIGAATALVMTGHTAEEFWGWPLYAWLYGLGVFAIAI